MKLLIAIVIFTGINAGAQSKLERQGLVIGGPKPKTETQLYQEKMRAKAVAATNAPVKINTNDLVMPPESFGSKAYYTGRRACELALKSPSSAKFSNPNSDASTGWQPFGYYQWKVFGQVDAKNPLGVLLREDWQAVVQYNVGQFEVVYLKVGAQESGTMPGIRKAPGN